MSTKKVIAIDLDGTLTLTDTLYESILALLQKKNYLVVMNANNVVEF